MKLYLILEKFRNFNERLANCFQYIGQAALVLIMVVTCIDVVGAKIFLSPLAGSIDTVNLAQIVAMTFAVSFTQVIGRHVRVTFLIDRLPKRLKSGVNTFVFLALVAFFVVLTWRSAALGYSLYVTKQGSTTVNFPLFYFAYGIAVACVPLCLIYMQECLNSLVKVVRR